jgi:Putative  PD-(D/E)XK family member, (DUF4420)
MNVVEELNTKWNEAGKTSRGGHEWRAVALSISSPVRLLAAIREPDERIALLVEGPMSAAPSMKLYFETQGLSLAEQRRPSENVFRLAVALERSEVKDVFEALCADLVFVVSVVSTPTLAFAAVTRRLEAWQACLRARQGALSREEQTGLLGELVVLRIVAGVIGHSAAVEAWKGPLDGIHDFVAEGCAIEVKSVLGIGTHLRISHIDQLEFDGLSSLAIARVRFRQGNDGKSLPSYVAIVRREIADASPAAVFEFEDRLLRAGYLDVDAQHYGSMLLNRESVFCYTIDERFPRLSRATIPSAIVDGSYIIDENAIASFRRDGGYLHQMLRTKPGVTNG